METLETNAPKKAITRRDMRQMIAKQPVNRREIRHQVDLYYQLQDYRKGGANQQRAAEESDEPVGAFSKSIQDTLSKTEEEIKRYLDELMDATVIGAWAKSIVGIGPVISAALLAHIDIRQAPTVGHIWRFAGLDPTQHWLGAAKAKARVDAHVEAGESLEVAIPHLAVEIGCKHETLWKFATTDRDGEPIKLTKASLTKAAAKRPWNAALKVVCWKIGESFVKIHNNPDGFYGHIYMARKIQEEAKNERGDFSEQAAYVLDTKNIGKTTEAWKWYSTGKLPPAHIHARAKRYAVKLFLSAWHEVAYFAEFGVMPPKPYVIEHLGHADMIHPPNMHLVPGLAEAHGR